MREAPGSKPGASTFCSNRRDSGRLDTHVPGSRYASPYSGTTTTTITTATSAEASPCQLEALPVVLLVGIPTRYPPGTRVWRYPGMGMETYPGTPGYY
eukprot:2462878-Rhodomonas_salina.4